VEIPKQVHVTSQASGAWKAWTMGLFRGVCLGFVRTLGGCYETLTFPFPIPDDYQPLMEPLYVFSSD
jgi:putative exosortase-associated protein (TIGR04073 family)